MVNEYKFSIIYTKIKKYKEITSVLKIRNNIRFNYDTYSERFDTPIKDTNILANMPEISKLFRLTSVKYDNFEKIGGCERLYYMSISMYRQLFGEKIVVSTQLSKRINGNSVKIPMYNLNEPYLQNVTKYMKHIAVYQP